MHTWHTCWTVAASNIFEVVTKDADMTVSRADGELDGIPIDRNRTQAVFKGITAKELCAYFADIDVKMDWETAVDSCKLLEPLPELNASIYALNMKRVWPSAARNCVLLTQIVQLGPGEWLCHTDSIDHPKVPKGDVVRVVVQSSVFAKTVVRPGVVGEPTRADITCELDYYALVNPGGWAPPSVVSAVSRREFPKVLRSVSPPPPPPPHSPLAGMGTGRGGRDKAAPLRRWLGRAPVLRSAIWGNPPRVRACSDRDRGEGGSGWWSGRRRRVLELERRI